MAAKELAVPVATGEIIAPVNFTDIPETIKQRGRATGFEVLRDKLLVGGFEALMAFGVTPVNFIKLVLDVDKHAMFSELHSAKKRGLTEYDEWEHYQQYLRGEAELSDEPANPHPPQVVEHSEDKIEALIRATSPGSER